MLRTPPSTTALLLASPGDRLLPATTPRQPLFFALLMLACVLASSVQNQAAERVPVRHPPRRPAGAVHGIQQGPMPATNAVQANRRIPNRSVRQVSAEVVQDYDAMLVPGASEYSLEPIASPDFGSSSIHADACDGCGTVNGCCCLPVGCLLDWSRADLWFGMVGFNGAGNFLTTGSSASGQAGGSFGFQEGFNFGSRLPCLLGGQVGSQFGMRFTHTQLDGSVAANDHRTQTFLTAGLFRRVDYGLQGGIVVDYLHDDWAYQADLLQLRGELSFLCSPCHDVGFRFTDSQQVDDVTATVMGQSTPVMLSIAALNNYRFFYRYRFGDCGRGMAEWQAGFTEESGGILGMTLKTPLHDQLGLEVAATYGSPPDTAAVPYSQESWNLGMAIVWTPGRMFGSARDYYRPLLDVADNGSFIARILP